MTAIRLTNSLTGLPITNGIHIASRKHWHITQFPCSISWDISVIQIYRGKPEVCPKALTTSGHWSLHWGDACILLTHYVVWDWLQIHVCMLYFISFFSENDGQKSTNVIMVPVRKPVEFICNLIPAWISYHNHSNAQIYEATWRH